MTEYDNIPFNETQLYLSGILVEGVQSINTSWTYPDDETQAVGFNLPISDVVQGGLQSDITVNRFITSSSDVITGLFEGGASGHLTYGDEGPINTRGYVFSECYVSDYSCSCAVNEIPSSDFTLYSFGKAFGSIPGHGDQPGPEVEEFDEIVIPGPGDIDIIVEDLDKSKNINVKTNAVQDFEYRISMDWEPIYSLGSRDVSVVMLKGAPRVEVSLTMELNDLVPPGFTELVCSQSPIHKDITIVINDCQTNTPLKTLVCPCGRLMEFNQIGEVDGVLTVEIMFRSIQRTVGELKRLVF